MKNEIAFKGPNFLKNTVSVKEIHYLRKKLTVLA